MSYLKWSDGATLRLIQWVAGECMAALTVGDSTRQTAVISEAKNEMN